MTKSFTPDQTERLCLYHSRALLDLLPMSAPSAMAIDVLRNLAVRIASDGGGGRAPDDGAAIYVRTLGRFGVWIDNKALQFRRKTPKRPLGLLAALIAYGGRNVPVWRLADTVWGSFDGDAATSALEVTLYRLRQLLAPYGEAIVLKSGLVSIDERMCRVDTWELEAALQRSSRIDRVEDAILETQFAALYAGEFLEHTGDESWVIEPRSRMRRRFLDELLRRAELLEKCGSVEMAANWYERGMEIDPLHDTHSRGRTRCYRKLGRSSDSNVACFNSSYREPGVRNGGRKIPTRECR